MSKEGLNQITLEEKLHVLQDYLQRTREERIKFPANAWHLYFSG